MSSFPQGQAASLNLLFKEFGTSTSSPFWFALTAEIIGLSAHFLNATILQVTWNPILPNQTVTGYDAIIVQGDADVRRLSVDNDTTSIEFPNLNQCSNYTVRVAANTSVGIGNYSSFEFLTACG